MTATDAAGETATVRDDDTQATTITPLFINPAAAETTPTKVYENGQTLIDVNHTTDADGDDVWELIDTDAVEAAGLAIPFDEQTKGVVVVSAMLTPSVAAGKWAMMQV